MLGNEDPAHDLAMAIIAFESGRYGFTRRVARHLKRRGWDRSFVQARIAQLTEADFHKSQEHRDRPGVWLDIYRPRYAYGRLYLKFVFDEERDAFVLLSFCMDGEAH